MSELEPLPKDLADLFAEESASYTEAPGMRTRVLRGVETAIAFSAIAGAGAGAATSVSANAPGSATTTTTKPGVASGIAAKKVVLIAVAAFVAGGASGEIHARFTTPPVPTTSPVAPATPLVLPVPAATTDRGVPFQNLPTIATSSLPAIAPAPTASSKESATSLLAAEQALIDTARSALSRGRGADALAAADDHAKKFPAGRLGEERENIAIQALIAMGRREEAKRRAEQFHRAYPGSLYAGAIDAVLQRTGEGGAP